LHPVGQRLGKVCAVVFGMNARLDGIGKGGGIQLGCLAEQAIDHEQTTKLPSEAGIGRQGRGQYRPVLRLRLTIEEPAQGPIERQLFRGHELT